MRDRKGLTLTEILVVVFIFLMLSSVLFTVFKSALDSWRRSENVIVMLEDARTALELISRDISAAFLFQRSNDKTQWTKFYGIDQSGTKIKNNSSKDELFFIAPVALREGEAKRTDLCEIGYWLDGKGRQDSSDGALMRHFETFSGLPVTYSFATPQTGADTAIARNVMDLQFTYYYRNAAGAKPSSVATQWDSDMNGFVNYDAGGHLKNPDGLPDAVGISITLRSRDGAQTKTFTALVLLPSSR